MRGIKNILILAFIAMVAAVPNLSAQRCGGSTNYIWIYVRDGSALINPRYELISISPTGLLYDDPKLAKFVSDNFFPNERPRRPEFWHMESFIVDSKAVEKFLKNYKAADYDPAPDWRPLKKEQFSGRVAGGEITLPTGEMFNYPYILKIYADNQTPMYVLGPHLGGCFSSEKIILDGKESKAYWGRWKD
jgi:hypothetical protein